MSAAEKVNATFGGGCFWCLEAVFSHVPGITDVISGYCGGYGENPNYRSVCGGETGHAEVVRLSFDPALISYEDLLDIFFVIHDPTTLNRQGHDVGSQYRSVIYVHSSEQNERAQAKIQALEAEQVFAAPVVTQVEPAPAFYAAEDYHRQYFSRHPEEAYCQTVVAPKLAKYRQFLKLRGLL